MGGLFAFALALAGAALADTDRDAYWGAVEAELLTELALQVAAVASIQEAGGKQHDGWWLCTGLGSE